MFLSFFDLHGLGKFGGNLYTEKISGQVLYFHIRERYKWDR